MQLQIVLTTDGKHIGEIVEFDPGEPLALAGFVFRPREAIDLGGGHWRFKNPHYTADAEIIKET